MTNILKLDKRGNSIGDNPTYCDNLRDIDAILEELKEVRDSFSTDAMSEYTLYLQGIKDGLSEVIEYLERV